VFGDLVRGHRLRLALTQDDLAARAGLGVRSIRHIEGGSPQRLRQHTIRALADAFGLAGEERETFYATAAGAASRPSLVWPTPAQLPPDLTGFAGRRDELDRLTALLGDTSTVVISAIAGTAGVGKTALAVHWSYQVMDRFPDGQLYLNLRGYEPAAVLRPAEAVRGFLDAFGVRPERVPADPAAQIGLYRSLLAGRRMLVVLDNARDAEQVRPLLPGAPGCLVLVTSRNDMSGLVAFDGARALTLDLLAIDEAHELLRRRLGGDRLTAEPQAVEEIIARCGQLPLALAIVAARAAGQPQFPLAGLATGLRDAGLDALGGADPASDVGTVFGWSYRALSPEGARLFRLLGLHPGPHISASAAASLAGAPVAQVRPWLAELGRAHLIGEPEPDRYTLHDLLRAYATELMGSPEAGRERLAALTRLFDHYVHTTHAADRQVHPLRDPIPLRLEPAAAGTMVEPLADKDDAICWLSDEHPVLVAAIPYAADGGFDSRAWQLAWAFDTFLDRRGDWEAQATAWQAALLAARRLRDLPAQAFAHRTIAVAHAALERYGDAQRHFDDALELATSAGDQVGQARTHCDLGFLRLTQGDPRGALHHTEQALALFRSAGHGRGTATALNDLGWCHGELGDHRRAVEHCEQALAIFERLGERHGEASTWDSLGNAHHQLGDHKRAAECYGQAIELHRQLGDDYFLADAIVHLGDVHRATGDPEAARAAWQEALEILTRIDHPEAEAVRTRLDGLASPPPV